MKPRDEDLVRVLSASEVRPGMFLLLKPCKWHKRDCGFVLLRFVVPYPHHRDFDGVMGPCHSKAAWLSTHKNDDVVSCFCESIDEGRLYRLRDEAPGDDQHTTEDVPKAKERVK